MFEPWIGNTYHLAANSAKTLILGESHYGEHHNIYNYELSRKTIHCVEDQIIHNNPYRFYTKLISSFIGHRPTLAEKKCFLHSIAFHNLITTPLTTARKPPTFKQWQESLFTLPGVIESLRPDYVVVLGYRMWHHVSTFPGMRKVPEITNAGPCGVRIFGDCFFHGIMHPSGPYSPAKWHEIIQSTKRQLWPQQ